MEAIPFCVCLNTYKEDCKYYKYSKHKLKYVVKYSIFYILKNQFRIK